MMSSLKLVFLGASLGLLIATGTLMDPDGVQTSGASREQVATGVPKAAAHRGIRRAVLIGVGSYDNPEIESLKGPPHDVQAFERLLKEKFHFDEVEWFVSGDGQVKPERLPTRKNVRTAILKAIGKTGPEDVLVVYWSGHGGLAPDVNGDELGSDPGSRTGAEKHDATLLTSDARMDGIPDVVDDELFLWFDKLQRDVRNVTLIIDACHSATIVRGRGPGLPVGLKERAFKEVDDRTPLYETYSDFTFNRETPDRERILQVKKEMDLARTLGGDRQRRILPNAVPYVVITAVSDIKGNSDGEVKYTAYEDSYSGIPRGILSHVLWNEMERLPPGSSVKTLMARVEPGVKFLSYEKMLPGLMGPSEADVKPFLFVEGDTEPRLVMNARYKEGNLWEVSVPPSMPVSPLDTFVLVRRTDVQDAYRKQLALLAIRSGDTVSQSTGRGFIEASASAAIPDRKDVVAVRFNIPFDYDRPIVYVLGFPEELLIPLITRIQADHPSAIFRAQIPSKDPLSGGPAAERYFKLTLMNSSSHPLLFGSADGKGEVQLLDQTFRDPVELGSDKGVAEVLDKVSKASYGPIRRAEIAQILRIEDKRELKLEVNFVDGQNAPISVFKCPDLAKHPCGEGHLRIQVDEELHWFIVHVLDHPGNPRGPSLEVWEDAWTLVAGSAKPETSDRLPPKTRPPASMSVDLSRTDGTDHILVFADTNPMRFFGLLTELQALEGRDGPRGGRASTARRRFEVPTEPVIEPWAVRKVSFVVQ